MIYRAKIETSKKSLCLKSKEQTHIIILIADNKTKAKELINEKMAKTHWRSWKIVTVERLRNSLLVWDMSLDKET